MKCLDLYKYESLSKSASSRVIAQPPLVKGVEEHVVKGLEEMSYILELGLGFDAYFQSFSTFINNHYDYDIWPNPRIKIIHNGDEVGDFNIPLMVDNTPIMVSTTNDLSKLARLIFTSPNDFKTIIIIKPPCSTSDNYSLYRIVRGNDTK